MLELISRHGLLLVFANVLAEQAGLPIPAFPTLIVAGALAADGTLSAPALLVLALLASTLGNAAWFAAGRIWGRRVTRLLCLIALSPDSCVRQMEQRFIRWGNLALVAANFIPGLSTVARPLAGATGVGWPRFLAINSLGILIWAGTALGLGALFHDQVNVILETIEAFGTTSVEMIAVLFAGYVVLKAWQRHTFFKMLRVARVSVPELRDLMGREPRPLVVDLRSMLAREEESRTIPGALVMELADVGHSPTPLPDDREIVFYCTCPNEASAAYAAMQLVRRGYSRVRPLLGGMDAWVEAGYELGQPAMLEEPATAEAAAAG